MKKKKLKPNPKKIIAIILLLVLFITGAGAIITGLTANKESNEIIENQTNITQIEETNEINDFLDEWGAIPIPSDEDYIWTTMYTTTGVNIRIAPSLDAVIDTTVPINTEVQVGTLPEEWDDIVVIADENWSFVKTNATESGIGYIYSKYLSTEKTVIKKQTTTNNKKTAKKTTSNSTGVLTKSKGVNYYNGHKETWYSQKVLPGGGLKIPGRHVNSQGLVCDGDGYICVASSDYTKGTVVETSLGTGKVYDCGCASGTIDIYTNW